LPFEVAAVAAWDVFFFGGVISIWCGFFGNGLRMREEILSVDSRDLNESINM